VFHLIFINFSWQVRELSLAPTVSVQER